MPARRELLAALGACLLGAVLTLAASVLAWVRVTVPRSRPLADAVVAVAGRDLAPAVPALGLVGLAGVVGLVATRARGRFVLGAALAGCGVAVLLAAGAYLTAPSPAAAATLAATHAPLPGRDLTRPVEASAEPVWPALAAVGGLLLAAAGAASAVRGRRWPAMSGRYDAPSPAPAATPAGQAGRIDQASAPDRVAPDRASAPDQVGPVPSAGSESAGSAHRDAPGREAQPTSQRLWDALDRGDDPTA